jgi:LmbE family N-acetylglucosaminyl deacetylase
LGDVVALYRKHKPDVVMLHDERGEYGHGVHRLISEAGRKAADAAADPARYLRSFESDGIWDVPKIYMHLYEENVIRMNWHVPLERFDGQTAYQIAEQAFLCHRSQSNDWDMHSGQEYDNSLFGLWRSMVGEDVQKADLFENIP